MEVLEFGVKESTKFRNPGSFWRDRKVEGEERTKEKREKGLCYIDM
jgi:hypothetical protein